MGRIDNSYLIWIILPACFISGFALIVAGIIGGFESGVGFGTGVFVLSGSTFVIFSTIFFYLHYVSDGPITWGGKTYDLHKEYTPTERVTDDLNEESLDTVIPLLSDISEGIRAQEHEISHQFDKSALQKVINMVSEQLAMREYINSSENHLRVVGFESSEDKFINAVSEDSLDLSPGLVFTILSDGCEDSAVQGRIGTAELVETESSEGNLFQFTIRSWRREEDTWKRQAKDDIRNGRARLTIITEDLVDIDKEELETALNCLRIMRYHEESEYGY